MKENMERMPAARKAVALITLAASSLALSSCSTEKEDSWVFAVTCPSEQALNVTSVRGSSVVMRCETDDIDMPGVAPTSIELIDGKGVEIVDDFTESASRLTVGYHYDNIPLSIKPKILTMEIRTESQDALVAMDGVRLSEVSVQSPQE